MHKHKVIYGVKVGEKTLLHYGVLMIRRLLRGLFLAPSVDWEMAESIINRLLDRNISGLDEPVQILESEIGQIKVLVDSLHHPPVDYTLKFQDWINKIGYPDIAESEEYVDFFRIDRAEARKMRRSGSIKPESILSPVDIKNILDKFVISQEEAKKQISFAFYLHLIRNGLANQSMKQRYEQSSLDEADLPKPRMMLIGPTGSGKTFIINTLCEKFGIPFIKVDCASLTSSGYVGKAIDEYFYLLLKKNDFNPEKVSGALIYFDEFDKLSETGYGQNSGSIGGREVQQEFLSVIEDREIVIQPPKGANDSTYTLNVSNMMFVFSGSFSGIEQLIRKKLNHAGIGFKKTSGKRNQDSLDEIYMSVEQQDIVGFGIIPELAGRINFIVPVRKLVKQDILDILKKSEFSPLKAYQNYFGMHGDELIITDATFEMIAEEVVKKGTGARGITTVLQKLLSDYLFESPGMENKQYVITPGYFRNKM